MNFGIKGILRVGLVILFLGSAARPASADWLLTPYLGIVFGGASNTFDIDELDDNFEQRFNFGGSLAWMGEGIVGFEVDYSLSPNFFQVKGPQDDIELLNLDSSVQSLMANLIIGIPVGGTSGPGIRPYAAGGLGLLRASLSDAEDLFDDLSTNELGFNVGGGIKGFFTDNVGIQADVRYFRAVNQDDGDSDGFVLEDFDFWRGTVGVTFRFGQ